jgi:hypothetical protein
LWYRDGAPGGCVFGVSVGIHWGKHVEGVVASSKKDADQRTVFVIGWCLRGGKITDEPEV